ncbi:MAG: succinate dehydrogenase, hydrophobic membrane anchor protein [Planctomycetes bacterium]|nr:succinate dehydrogenase, hydrophobic membrane anchor protein [Planctomycetota bacterium]
MSMRSPLGRVRGLGSAREGVGHWWAQRMTALALVPLALWFVAALVALTGADHASARDWIGAPVPASLLVLLIVATFYHGALGLQLEHLLAPTRARALPVLNGHAAGQDDHALVLAGLVDRRVAGCECEDAGLGEHRLGPGRVRELCVQAGELGGAWSDRRLGRFVGLVLRRPLPGDERAGAEQAAQVGGERALALGDEGVVGSALLEQVIRQQHALLGPDHALDREAVGPDAECVVGVGRADAIEVDEELVGRPVRCRGGAFFEPDIGPLGRERVAPKPGDDAPFQQQADGLVPVRRLVPRGDFRGLERDWAVDRVQREAHAGERPAVGRQTVEYPVAGGLLRPRTGERRHRACREHR